METNYEKTNPNYREENRQIHDYIKKRLKFICIIINTIRKNKKRNYNNQIGENFKQGNQRGILRNCNEGCE